MKFRFTRPAIRDLAEIGRYSRDTWGEQQARRYQAAMTTRLEWLCHNRSLWRDRPEIFDGVYTYPEQHHVIVFRNCDVGIEILRILHRRMDLVSAVKADKPG